MSLADDISGIASINPMYPFSINPRKMTRRIKTCWQSVVFKASEILFQKMEAYKLFVLISLEEMAISNRLELMEQSS